MSVIIILFFVVVLQFHQWLWCGVSIALNKLFLGGGGEGHSSFRYPWKGMQSESEHKIIGFI